jgi:cyclase
MLAKRIIPCLDVKDGRTVKGTNFVNLRDAGDAVELAKIYSEQGADELGFSPRHHRDHRKRRTFSELVRRVAWEINIPVYRRRRPYNVEDIEILINAAPRRFRSTRRRLKIREF